MALQGIKVLEIAGLAPAPFCGMILADFGASVIRVDKVESSLDVDCLAHGKKSIAIDLKNKKGVEIFRRLSGNSDVVIEPFRKGVMEKLGLGPDVLQKDNSRLVYARLSGFGHKGVYSARAGHDINYVAVSGLLSMLGWEKTKKPSPPLNLVADFGGGGLMCALGIMFALYEREKSGLGQVVDCSMVEGSAYLGSWIFRTQQMPFWGNERCNNILDGGTSCYDTYETKDGKHMAVGALESQFYSKLINALGVSYDDMPQFTDDMERNRRYMSKLFKERTRDEWCKIFDGIDACVTPVLSLKEASEHEHNIENGTFLYSPDGHHVPRPSPVLSRTPGESNIHKTNPAIGQNTEEILSDVGYLENEIQSFADLGAIMKNKL